MVTESILRIPVSFRREFVSESFGRKLYPPPLKLGPVGSTNCYILRVMCYEIWLAARGHQLTATQGEAAVTYIIAILKLRPRCPNVIEIHKVIPPPTSVEHMSIPLSQKTVRSRYMIDELIENKIRICP
ncbi:hypothetical protein EDF57_11415 [Novosphingobium sp. PhB55]|nr:hypothetical protein EDF57_11415 [Novosphingobium sp. PhB55]